MNKTVKRALIVLAGIVILFAAFQVARYVSVIKTSENRSEEVGKEAEAQFEKLCGYVSENLGVFEEFSEYQLSFLSENEPSFIIEKDGDMQEMRDIALKYFTASAGMNEDGEMLVRYSRDEHSYVINVVYVRGGAAKKYGDKKMIGGNIYAFWVRTGY